MIDPQKNRAPSSGYDRARWTGRDAIIACVAPFKEQLFFHRTGRAQPINTRRCRRGRFVENDRLFDEFMRGPDRRDNRIFQEISPAI